MYCTPQLTTLILNDPGGGPLLLMAPYVVMYPCPQLGRHAAAANLRYTAEVEIG